MWAKPKISSPDRSYIPDYAFGMSWNGKGRTFPNVEERGFLLSCEGRTVPGAYWAPTVNIQSLNQVVLLDHPATGYGTELERFSATWKAGGGTTGIVADWRAALDFVESVDGIRPVGYWGLSMGTTMGLPVCVNDERIGVAVLGLMGTWGPNGDDLRRLAPEFELPTRFLVQWDDEVVPRDRCLELFDALGSKKKSLHANPGRHAAVPTFEVLSSLDYLAKELARQ